MSVEAAAVWQWNSDVATDADAALGKEQIAPRHPETQPQSDNNFILWGKKNSLKS